MSSVDVVSGENRGELRGRPPWWALVTMLLSLLLVFALLSLGQPGWVALCVAVPWLGYALIANANAAAGLALFLLYSNVIVISIHFHSMPSFVAWVLPGLLMIPVMRHLLVDGEPWIWPRATPWIFGFLIVQAMGTLLARDPRAAYDGLKVSLTEGVVLYFLIVNAVRTPSALRWATWSLVAAGVLMAGAVFHQFVTDAYQSNYGGLAQVTSEGFGIETADGLVGQLRAAGPIGVENRFAQILLMLFPLGLYCMWGEPHWVGRLLAGFAMLVIVSGWAVTFSRGAFVALGLTVFIMVLGGYIRLRQLVPLVLLVSSIMLLVPQYRERIISLTTVPSWLVHRDQEQVPDGAVTGRATVMLAAARVYADYPLFGVGPTLFPTYAIEYGNRGGFRELRTDRQAHNLYLSIAAEQGTLGFVTFFGALTVTLWELQRARHRSQATRPDLVPYLHGFTLVLLVYLTTGLFEHFSFIRYYWCMLALAAAACTAVRYGVEEQPDEPAGEQTPESAPDSAGAPALERAAGPALESARELLSAARGDRPTLSGGSVETMQRQDELANRQRVGDGQAADSAEEIPQGERTRRDGRIEETQLDACNLPSFPTNVRWG